MLHVGLHLRVVDSLPALAQQASMLGLPFFQSFLSVPSSTGWMTPSAQEITYFRKMCEKKFSRMYAHGAFWLNLADPARSSLDGLWDEMLLAQRLGFTHLIMHPGSSVKGTKQQGIEMVARTLNKLFLKESQVQLVLENTAHGNRAVGSDLKDLYAIRALLDKPEKLLFCIDTAHAHAYGYEVRSPEGMRTFLNLIDHVLGVDAVALLHLNDACEEHGSFKDRHAILGEGTLGEAVLKIAYHEYVRRNIPIIIEPPAMAHDDLLKLYNNVKNW